MSQFNTSLGNGPTTAIQFPNPQSGCYHLPQGKTTVITNLTLDDKSTLLFRSAGWTTITDIVFFNRSIAAACVLVLRPPTLDVKGNYNGLAPADVTNQTLIAASNATIPASAVSSLRSLILPLPQIIVPPGSEIHFSTSSPFMAVQVQVSVSL